MTPLAYENATFWCVRKRVLVIKKQKVIQKKTFENHLEKSDPIIMEDVHFRCLNFYRSEISKVSYQIG